MTKTAVSLSKSSHTTLWRNMLRFILMRVFTLGVAIVGSVYLTIIIANYGGFVDEIVASQIEFQVGAMMMGDWNSELPSDERLVAAEQLIEMRKEQAGLNDPFLWRSAQWLGKGITLNWGEPTRSRNYGINAAGSTVAEIIVSNLSRTLLVFGLANVLLFITAVLIALYLNRRHGTWLDQLFILLSPISSAPAWVYGVLLSVFLLRVFGFSPGGTFDSLPEDFRFSYLLIVLRHLTLPFAALFLSGLFQTVYTWRSYFQIYSNEQYVEMAYAKGLRNGRIDRVYIMRPALPALLTSFALMIAVLWQEIIALEFFFNVQGIGRLFTTALRAFDTPMIVAIVTTFAYLIALTVLVLDIFYTFVDPRVRVGSQQQEPSVRLVTQKRRKQLFTPAIRLPKFALPSFVDITAIFKNSWSHLLSTTKELKRYPSAIIGILIICALFAVSIYAVVTIPYQEAITLWRREDNEWQRIPRAARPEWVNAFRQRDLPPTLRFTSVGNENITIAQRDGGANVTIPFTFTYDYGDFPQDIVLDFTTQFKERGPHVAVTWIWPDGSERELTSFQPGMQEAYFVSRDNRLQRRLRSDFPHEALFLGPEQDAKQPVEGSYTVRVDIIHFEPDSHLDVELTMLGQVYGLAGTDDNRRDLMVPLLWGTPIALGFGLIASITTSVGGMLIAAIGAWYGGMIDRIVQFLTEVNLILPFFPVSLMVFILYSKSIVVILAVTVALTLFSSSVKTYRATFLQVQSATYIEAARAYGATNSRIVVRYMIPSIINVLIPRMIILVPGYIFLEASLAFLGITDPTLPTWGKLIVAALSYGVYRDTAHLVIAPFLLLFITGFAFAMLGLALERIFDPRLQDE